MADGGADSPAPPSGNGGEYLLSLLHRRPYQQNHNPSPSPDPQHQSFALDPAISAVGPTVNPFSPSNWPSNGLDRPGNHNPPWPLAFSPPNLSPNLLGFSQFPLNPFLANQFDGNQRVSAEDPYRLGFPGTGNSSIQSMVQQQHQPPQKLVFGSFSGDATQSLNGILKYDSKHHEQHTRNSNTDPNLSHHRNQDLHEHRGGYSGRGNWGPIGNIGRGLKSTPPGFSSNQRGSKDDDSFQRNHDKAMGEQHSTEEQQLLTIDAIEASYNISHSSSSSSTVRATTSGHGHEDPYQSPNIRPRSITSPTAYNQFPLSRCKAKSSNFPAMRFGGRILYSKTASEVDKRAMQLLKVLETKRNESGKAIVGFDMEWKPSFIKGVLPRKVATVQICVDNNYCDVMHIFHAGIPQSLQDLIEDSTLVKVGIGIDGDSVKLFHDYGVSIKDAEDLSDLANTKLGGDSKRWGLASLTETLVCKKLLKPNKIRLGNWEVHPLSKEQLQYAATDAYVSWHLYQILKDLPDAVNCSRREGGKLKEPQDANHPKVELGDKLPLKGGSIDRPFRVYFRRRGKEGTNKNVGENIDNNRGCGGLKDKGKMDVGIAEERRTERAEATASCAKDKEEGSPSVDWFTA